MGDTLRVAAAQIEPAIFEKSKNLEKVVAWTRQAASEGARLVVFPEAALSGYCFDSLDEALPMAEPVPGPSTERIQSLCGELGLWVALGMLERDGNRIFNTAVLIGPGRIAGTYRKVHLPFLGVDRFTTRGTEGFSVLTTPLGRIGLNICYDAAFPESSRILALEGAELILLPTNWPKQAFRYPRYTIPTRSQENVVNYVACDRVGEERGVRFLGRSILVNTLGDPLTEGSEDREELLVAEIDMAAARKKRWVGKPGVYELDRIGDRRPDVYGRILAR